MPETSKNTLLRRMWHENAAFILTTLGYMALVFAISRIFHLESLLRFDFYLGWMPLILLFNGFVFFIGYLFYLLVSPKIQKPLTQLVQATKSYFTEKDNIPRVLVVLVFIPFIVSSYTSFKNMIPGVMPFYLDEAFMKFDQALHFGVHPWQLTHAIFSGPYWTAAINFFYHTWFFLQWSFLFWQILFNRKLRGRMQYILTFSLSWVLIGSLGAVLLSSAGPVYYANVTGLASPFTALIESLRGMDSYWVANSDWVRIWALGPQDMLWEKYQASELGIGSGISAMPSMHLSVAAVMMLGAYPINKVFGHVMALFLVIMLIGSVHLGWHYAIDGYLGIVLTILLWKVAGKISAKVFPSREKI